MTGPRRGGHRNLSSIVKTPAGRADPEGPSESQEASSREPEGRAAEARDLLERRGAQLLLLLLGPRLPG